MKNDDLIYRRALMDYINDTHPYAGLPMAAHICTMELLTYAPAVDAKEVVHAKWIRKPVGPVANEIHCSACNAFIGVTFSETGFKEAIEGMNYCCSCGAKMDRKDED
jgi:hypothetical protein